MMSDNIFWDKNSDIDKIKKVLKDSSNAKFIEYASLLLSRMNTPKEVFSEYLDVIVFCRNWNAIKRRMRQNKWNDKRIIFWDEVYKIALKNIDKGKIGAKKAVKKTAEKEMVEIGSTLRKARKGKAWTQKNASKETGVSQQTISSIENGNINFSFKTINKIAKTLGLKIALKPKEEISTFDGTMTTTQP